MDTSSGGRRRQRLTDEDPHARILVLERALKAKERELQTLRERVTLFANLAAWGGRLPAREVQSG